MGKIKPIRVIADKELKEALERYRLEAINLGASDARVIITDKVYVDNRVLGKCTIPKCPSYGTSAHCPPHTLEPDRVRELVRGYRYALLVKIELDPSIVVGEDLRIEVKGGKIVPTPALAELLKWYRKIRDIVIRIESMAFYDGYYLSTSFAAGSCHADLCKFQECLVLKNQSCRFPLIAGPSMEGSSMDVFRMVTEAGWEIYPIGGSCSPSDIPYATLVGLVLIQ